MSLSAANNGFPIQLITDNGCLMHLIISLQKKSCDVPNPYYQPRALGSGSAHCNIDDDMTGGEKKKEVANANLTAAPENLIDKTKVLRGVEFVQTLLSSAEIDRNVSNDDETTAAVHSILPSPTTTPLNTDTEILVMTQCTKNAEVVTIDVESTNANGKRQKDFAEGKHEHKRVKTNQVSAVETVTLEIPFQPMAYPPNQKFDDNPNNVTPPTVVQSPSQLHESLRRERERRKEQDVNGAKLIERAVMNVRGKMIQGMKDSATSTAGVVQQAVPADPTETFLNVVRERPINTSCEGSDQLLPIRSEQELLSEQVDVSTTATYECDDGNDYYRYSGRDDEGIEYLSEDSDNDMQ